MRAIVYDEYGPPEVLHLAEVEKPAFKADDVLIKVHATTVGYGDLTARNFRNLPPSEFNMPSLFWFPVKIAFGIRKPRIRILGSEFAGEIEAVGANVTRFKKGDRVFGYCGMRMGAYAENLRMPANGTMAIMPATMSYEEAATIPYGAIMASSLLRKVTILPGSKVLINGASGGIGSHAVRLAKHRGAEVTGVCGTPRMEFVKSLGADKVIDYTKEDFTKKNGTYDVVFDILGRSSFSRCRRSIAPDGRYLLASFKTRQLLQMLWTSLFRRKKVICAMASEKAADLDIYRELIDAGKIKTVIDRCFPLEQAAEAHRYVEEGNRKGHVVITVAKDKE